LDRNAYKQGKKEKPPFVKSESPEPVPEDDDKKIPGELLCLICNSLLTDAVVIPCCGNSYCDDCKLLYVITTVAGSFAFDAYVDISFCNVRLPLQCFDTVG